MTGREKTTVALIVAVTIVVTLIVIVATPWLTGQGWFGVLANIIQLLSGPATFAAVAAGVMMYLNRTCAAHRYCFRFGEHPVDGTLQKVCDHHHSFEHHVAVHLRYAPEHQGKLDRGESHDTFVMP